MSAETATSAPCQTCATRTKKTFSCIQCNNLAFCDTCWPKWILHQPGAVGWNGKPHEKADPAVVNRLRQILEPARSEAEHESELLEDQDTTWFGFGRDATGHPLLHDYGRFAAIMGETVTEDKDNQERYPQLASFIGETGAGKSTLIKLLIDRQDLTSSEESRYYSPVTSSNKDRISTTGDVHLYADPSGLYGNHPLLYVDCEGLSGGEAVPKQLRMQDDTGYSPTTGSRPRRHTSPRKIEWAETPQTQKREFAVSQLYPRILYTFSDVVVFVLRNPRSFESTVLSKLIRWGAASIDKSINQPALPHAIIVLNATDANVDENEWDVAKATKMLLTDIQDAIFREPVLRDYVQTWRRRGRQLDTTKDLLECYYASISVVRVPYKGSYMLMDEQAGKLSDLIKERCAASQAKKKQMRMLANTERLQFYLQAAYDHFTRDLNTPFDFVKETLRHSPVSRNFEGNILNLALSIKDGKCDPALKNNAEEIFRVIGPMVASCVMFDAVRQNIPGTVSRLLNDRYSKSCVGAMQTFADMYWPCSYVNTAYDGEMGRCCNVRSGHNPKGHQNKQGKIIGQGDYESTFSGVRFQPIWEQLIRSSLVQVQSSSFRLAHEFPSRTELQIASLLHRERLNELYSNTLGPATNFVSYSACLCCLRELPECALPCGHVLCLPCIEIYGTRTSKTTIEVSRCPLHARDLIATPPWVITTKPRYAGARTLCLDGGGIRGIIQLHVLRAIEKALGADLPIQLFFDLIVGTNTGGIIAIALGVKKWTVEATIEKFKDLCREAFVRREMNSVPLIGALSSFYHRSVYKTQPLERALRRHFSDRPFYGGATHRSRLTTSNRVAVTATTATGRQPVVFANYNRPDPMDTKIPYQFTRADVPAKEIKMWEAARSTFATSPLFKPFTKPETNIEYANGDLDAMCPIAVAHYEAKSIWNDIADAPPDLLLSIGAGRNVGDRTMEELPGAPSLRVSTNETVSTGSWQPSAVVRQGRGGMGNYKRHATMPSIASDDVARNAASGYIVRNPQAPMLVSFNNPIVGQTDRLNDRRQCDKVWNRFVSSRAARDGAVNNRYRRICPELFSRMPKFDEVQKMDELEHETKQWLRVNSQEVAEIAHRLVASSFFFERDTGSVKQKASGLTCTGSIYCRLRPSSPEIKALGWFLIGLLVAEFEPYFVLEEANERSASWPIRKIVLSSAVLQDMHLQGTFRLDPIRIHAPYEHSDVKISLCLQDSPYPSGAKTLPISGFPRRVMAEDGGIVAKAAAHSRMGSVIEKPPSSSGTGADRSDRAATPGPFADRAATPALWPDRASTPAPSVEGAATLARLVDRTVTPAVRVDRVATPISAPKVDRPASPAMLDSVSPQPITRKRVSHDDVDKLSLLSLGSMGGDFYFRAELEG
ncbi:hypothetical protein F5Y15DRAFT_373717 [Xylariaceae sp. FL0016]|nr:hypothetical protein F5Y15DRAFT_373717 [Xylariaceae sp. FL0016]